jgi:hypothetical protein
LPKYISLRVIRFGHHHLLNYYFEFSLVEGAKKLMIMKARDSKFDLLLVESVVGDGDSLGYFVRVDCFAIARVVDGLSFERIGFGSTVER